MDDEMAIAQLTALAGVPGALRIITSEILPRLRVDRKDARSPIHPEQLQADPDILKRVSSHVCHDVVKVSGPDERGLMRADSAEGDVTIGRPAALLARLTEASREPSER